MINKELIVKCFNKLVLEPMKKALIFTQTYEDLEHFMSLLSANNWYVVWWNKLHKMTEEELLWKLMEIQDE